MEELPKSDIFSCSPAPCEPVSDPCDCLPDCNYVDLCHVESEDCKCPWPPLHPGRNAIAATKQTSYELATKPVLDDSTVSDTTRQANPILGLSKKLEMQVPLGRKGKTCEIEKAQAAPAPLEVKTGDRQVTH